MVWKCETVKEVCDGGGSVQWWWKYSVVNGCDVVQLALAPKT